MTESLIFAGTPANAATTLEYLVKSGFDISLVITRQDAPVGRKRVLTPSAVALTAERLGLQVHKTNAIDDPCLTKIAETGCKTAVVVAFGALLKQTALQALSNGWFNLHYSLLPKYRGAAPVQHAILNGDRETGVTLFKIDKGLDTGDLVGSVPTHIQPGENSARLLSRLTELGCTLLNQELPGVLLESHSLIPQDEAKGVSLAPKLDREQARIDWTRSALQIERQVLAMNPEPGAWTTLGGESFKIHEARELARGEAGAPGLVAFTDGRIIVASGEGAVELLQVQPAGKQPMPATDWARGVALPARFDA